VELLGELNIQHPPSLLRFRGDFATLSFAAAFDPQIAFAKKLPNVVEAVMKLVKAPNWGVTADHKYVIRETQKKYFYLFDNQVFFCHTLGLSPWLSNVDVHIESMSIALNKMDVTKIKRFGLEIRVQLPLEMSHSEMCDLMFGSYLLDRDDLSSTYGRIDDLLLQLHGHYKDVKSRTIIAPQTVEQSKFSFLGGPNLELFLESKFTDTCVKEHSERISKECLHLNIDMFKENAPVSKLSSFLRDAFDGAEIIVEGTVRRIKALKTKELESHGDRI
jgi:hypothetical protein